MIITACADEVYMTYGFDYSNDHEHVIINNELFNLKHDRLILDITDIPSDDGTGAVYATIRDHTMETLRHRLREHDLDTTLRVHSSTNDVYVEVDD